MKLSILIVCSAALAVGSAAWGDHNSRWGAGWANMPNDIHNTRVDTRVSGDNELFQDFVRYGAGSTVPNRYLDGDDPVGNGQLTGQPAPRASRARR
jgi:hypothetical protein